MFAGLGCTLAESLCSGLAEALASGCAEDAATAEAAIEAGDAIVWRKRTTRVDAEQRTSTHDREEQSSDLHPQKPTTEHVVRMFRRQPQ